MIQIETTWIFLRYCRCLWSLFNPCTNVLNIYKHIHTYTHTQTHTDTDTHTQTQTHTDTHRDTDTHRHTHRQTHTQTHTHRHTQRHIQIHTDTHTDTHTRTHTHTHIHIPPPPPPPHYIQIENKTNCYTNYLSENSKSFMFLSFFEFYSPCTWISPQILLTRCPTYVSFTVECDPHSTKPSPSNPWPLAQGNAVTDPEARWMPQSEQHTVFLICHKN